MLQQAFGASIQFNSHALIIADNRRNPLKDFVEPTKRILEPT